MVRCHGARFSVSDTAGVRAVSHARRCSIGCRELETLIAVAQKEGEVTFYLGQTENVAKRIGGAFTAKYGIKTQYIRLGGAQLVQRYLSEADSGNMGADLLFTSGDAISIAENGIRKGWIESISKADIPVVKNGEFPASFNKGNTAIVQISPWLILYNTEKLQAAETPKDWPISSILDTRADSSRGSAIIRLPDYFLGIH